MPTYEYECRSCGRRFEAFQKMADAPLRECPECGGRVDRVIGAGVGILKGGRSRDRASRNTSCDRTSPCCGRTLPCDKPPCE